MEEKKKKTKSPSTTKSEIEFCKVCRLHHDQGKRHKFFPRHKDSLSTFLSRFRAKIADVRFFLENPIALRPEEESQNRVWCVFCDEDIVELGSAFACAKAINHLASSNHLKNLKHFIWKHGPGMDCIDNFRISQVDVAQWEIKCRSSRKEAASSSKGSRGQLYGPSNDIHNKYEFDTTDRIEEVRMNHVKSDCSNDVMPLQCTTIENQIPHSGLAEFTQEAASQFVSHSYLPNGFTGSMCGLDSSSYSGRVYKDNSNSYSEEVRQDNKHADGNYSSLGLLGITCISSCPKDAGGNVHTGAPPPWLDVKDTKVSATEFVSQANGPGKHHKLNPKRVGAAWAERRKLEMEMEKRGHVITCDTNDVDWLPNFGRVWQSGTRKESRKEFKKEKPASVKTESRSIPPVDLQPYISKRMRREEGD